MEETNNITRSALYKEIYEIVKQIPMKQVDTDAMDAPSASYLIEQLFKKWQQHGVMQAEGSDGAKGAAVASEGQGEANTCADCGRTKDEDGTCYSCEYGAMFGH